MSSENPVSLPPASVACGGGGGGGGPLAAPRRALGDISNTTGPISGKSSSADSMVTGKLPPPDVRDIDAETSSDPQHVSHLVDDIMAAKFDLEVRGGP